MLTEQNYYSAEANREYMSVSQYKAFMRCEAEAMASLNGEYEKPVTRALLVGSFVDSYFEGNLDGFMQAHPEIFTRKHELRADFRKANEIIKIVKNDARFMKYMSGEKQKIFTFELFGVKWKAKLDSYSPGICITDLKTSANIKRIPDFRYDIQGAVYQKGVEIVTGEKLQFWLAVVTKEKVPNRKLIKMPQAVLDLALEEVEQNLPHIMEVKNGMLEPERCGECAYCRQTTENAEMISYEDLMEVYRA